MAFTRSTPPASAFSRISKAALQLWKTGLPDRERTDPRVYGRGKFGTKKYSPKDDTRYNWTRTKPKIIALALLFCASVASAANLVCDPLDLQTSSLNLCKPSVDIEGATPWGNKDNNNWDLLDQFYTQTVSSMSSVNTIKASTGTCISGQLPLTLGANAVTCGAVDANTITSSTDPIQSGAVATIQNNIAASTTTIAQNSASLINPNTFASASTQTILGAVAIGVRAGANGTLIIQSTSTTNGTPILDVRNNAGTSVFTPLQNGNVGVGTSNPQARVDVVDGIRVNSAGNTSSGFANGLNLGTWDALAYNLAGTHVVLGGYRAAQWSGIDFYTSGSQRAAIDTNGNLGVGTSIPGYLLDVGAGTGLPAIRINGGTSGTSGPYMRFENAGVLHSAIGTHEALFSDATYNSTTTWYSDGDIILASGGSDKVRLLANGNFGIGNSSPLYPLEISKSAGGRVLEVDGAGTNALFAGFANGPREIDIGAESSVGGVIATGSLPYAGIISVNGGGTIQFAPGNTVDMTLLNGGNVGISSTTPTDALSVAGSINVTTGLKYNTTTGTNGVLTSAQTMCGGAWNNGIYTGGVACTAAGGGAVSYSSTTDIGPALTISPDGIISKVYSSTLTYTMVSAADRLRVWFHGSMQTIGIGTGDVGWSFLVDGKFVETMTNANYLGATVTPAGAARNANVSDQVLLKAGTITAGPHTFGWAPFCTASAASCNNGTGIVGGGQFGVREETP